MAPEEGYRPAWLGWGREDRARKHMNFKYLLPPFLMLGDIYFEIILYCIAEFELEVYTCDKGNNSPCMYTQKFHIQRFCFADSNLDFFF